MKRPIVSVLLDDETDQLEFVITNDEDEPFEPSALLLMIGGLVGTMHVISAENGGPLVALEEASLQRSMIVVANGGRSILNARAAGNMTKRLS